MKGKKMVSLEVSGDLKEALRVEAFHKNVTVSALIRSILEKELSATMRECSETRDDVAK